jgi:iron complex transport system substrate-binding protein
VLACIALTACRRAENCTQTGPAASREVVDEAGRHVRVLLHPQRIVSLAPNLTEIVYALGAGDRLVGDTTYCDYPEAARAVAKIGDTLHPSLERIIALRPELILVSTASQLETFTSQLQERCISVYVTDPHDLEAVLRSITDLGELFDEHEQAGTLVADLRARAAVVEQSVAGQSPVKVFYQLSREPLYTAGRDSFVTDLIKRAGGESVTANVAGAWPRYSDEAALAAHPEAIIMASEDAMGTASSTELAEPLKHSPANENKRVYTINGELLSRPGPRLIDGLEQLARALHPESFNSKP